MITICEYDEIPANIDLSASNIFYTKEYGMYVSRFGGGEICL